MTEAKREAAPAISVVIPNWNGIELLPRCLKQLTDAIESYSGEVEVIIIDNGSSDGSVSYILSSYPGFKVIQFTKNEGFAAACNKGAEKAKSDLLFFMNNDVFVEKGTFSCLTRHFNKKNQTDLFAVSCKLLYDKTNQLQLGRTKAKFQLGLFGIDFLPDIYNNTCETLYPSGGASIVDKAKFFALGGFDSHLFYFEDVDIGYRAWKRGWRTLYEPGAIVYHKCEATTSNSLGRFGIDTTIAKGRFVFSWKSLTSTRLRVRHFVEIPFLLAAAFIARRPHIYKGFLKALHDRVYAARMNSIEKFESSKTDEEVLKQISSKSIGSKPNSN